MILVWGKARSHRAPNLGCTGAVSPGWFYVLPKLSAQDVMHKQTCCRDEAASHQLPIAAAFWIIPVGFMEESSSLTQNLMQIFCSTHSVILNVMATQYTHSLNGMYCPHWLVHWSCYLSCAHSSPLSLAARLHWRHPNHSHYINKGWIFPGQTLFYIYTHTSIRFTYYKLYYVLTQYVCAHNIGYVYMYNLLHMLISLENPNTITVQ